MADRPGFKEGLPPVLDRRTRLLILGSLPSDESIRKREYYGNRQNRFWHLIGLAMSRDISELPYNEKLQRLRDRGIGLWDVYARAHRRGSADSNIVTPEPNDFVILKDICPHLQLICFNGRKAATQRKLIEDLGYRTIVLLSSSSANAGRDREREQQWKNLALFLR